jgi:hypothetical protein
MRRRDTVEDRLQVSAGVRPTGYLTGSSKCSAHLDSRLRTGRRMCFGLGPVPAGEVVVSHGGAGEIARRCRLKGFRRKRPVRGRRRIAATRVAGQELLRGARHGRRSDRFSPPQATCSRQVTERRRPARARSSCELRDVGGVPTGSGEQLAMTFRGLTSR